MVELKKREIVVEMHRILGRGILAIYVMHLMGGM